MKHQASRESGEHRIRLTLAERAAVADIAAALPDAAGRQFVTPDLAFRLALDVCRRVIAAGRLDEFRPVLPPAARP